MNFENDIIFGRNQIKNPEKWENYYIDIVRFERDLKEMREDVFNKFSEHQSESARKCGVSRQYINKCLTGENTIKIDKLIEYYKILKV